MTARAYHPFDEDGVRGLLDELSRRGYAIRPEHGLAIELLLLRLAEADALPENPRALAGYLGPLLCSSPEQQFEFPRHFTVWIERQLAAASDARPAVDEPVIVTPTLDEELRVIHRRTWRVRALLAVVIVALIATFRGNLAGRWRAMSSPAAADTARVSPAPSARRSRIGVKEAVEVAVPLVLVLIVVMTARRRFLLRKYASDPPQLDRLPIGSASNSAWLPPIHRDVAARMRQREPYEDEAIDVAATVQACAQAGGRFVPVYATRSRIPEYLVLIDRWSHDDLLAARASAMVETLRDQSVYADVYYFERDPRLLVSAEGSRRLTLTELQIRHPNHRLVLCADSSSLVSSLTGRVHSWASRLELWAHRSLLTSVPVVDWGARERAISSAGFRVLPLSPDGFAAVADSRFALQVIGDERSLARLPRRFPDRIADDELAWIDANEPSVETLSAGLREVHAYLGEQGYTWLAACAVYPEVKPALTLRLGEHIAGQDRASLAEPLARLPWMRAAFMPDWLRRALLDDLRGEREQSVRSFLRALMLSPGTAAGGSDLAVAASTSQSTLARLWKWRSASWRDTTPSGDPLRDHVFLTWLDNRLALRIPRALLRHLSSKRRTLRAGRLDPRTGSSARYFTVQGAYPPRGLAFLGLGIGVALVTGVAFRALLNLGYGLLNFIGFSLSFGIAAVGIDWIIRRGETRGARRGGTVGLLIGLAAIYGVMVGIEGILKSPLRTLQPALILITSSNSWDTNTALAVAAVLVLSVTVFGGAAQAQMPFCPVCRRWTRNEERILGPLADVARTTDDLVHERYARVFALSTTAPDKSDATIATLEHCDPACATTTLLTLKSRHSQRADHGLLVKSNDVTLLHRLYVPERLAREVYEWLAAIKSIRPNLAPPDAPELRSLLEMLLPLPPKGTRELLVFGDIPVDKAEKARKKMAIPTDVEIAALTELSGWFIVPFYEACAFTIQGVYACDSAKDKKAVFTSYDELARQNFDDTSAINKYLDSRHIPRKEDYPREAIMAIVKSRRATAESPLSELYERIKKSAR